MKKIVLSCFVFAGLVMFSGCWNYREVEKLDIVAGFAVDKGTGENPYRLTLDVVDISAKDSQSKSKVVECEGKTLLDAMRNASMREATMRLWSHAQIVVVSQEVAREDISPVLKLMIADNEPRPTLKFVISYEKTAREIFLGKATGKSIISYDINKALDYSSDLTGTVLNTNHLYQSFNILSAEGESLVLPVVRNVMNDKEKVTEIYGVACFKGSKLVGFLEPEDTRSFLFATDGLNHGILNERTIGPEYDVALKIKNSRSNVTPVYQDGKITMKIHIKTDVSLDEVDVSANYSNQEGREKLQSIAQQALRENVTTIVTKVQREFGTDIFGFGEEIRRKYPKQWHALRSDWDEHFLDVSVEVTANVNIIHNALATNVLDIAGEAR